MNFVKITMTHLKEGDKLIGTVLTTLAVLSEDEELAKPKLKALIREVVNS